MIALQSIIDRLLANAPGLRSVQGAAELAALLASKKPMTGQPFAHVVPNGMRGAEVSAATGLFVQNVEHLFAVYLTIPATADRAGSKALPDVLSLQNEVIAALVGWAPADVSGVFRLARAGLQRFEPGIIVYVIEFAIADQLRISP